MMKPHEGEGIVLNVRHAVDLATSSEAVMPKIPELAQAKLWGPRQATSSSVVPKHLIVLGGGAVGCEMANVYASLGSTVSLI